MEELQALAERAERLDPHRPQRLAELRDRISDRRRRRRTALVVLVLLAGAGTGLGVIARTSDRGTPDPAPLSHPDSDTPESGGASNADDYRQRAGEFYLPDQKTYVFLAREQVFRQPADLRDAAAVPSDDGDARRLITYFGEDVERQGKSRVWLFDDGRLITVREASDVPDIYLQRELTPAGVEEMRDRMLERSSPKRLEAPDWPYAAWLEVDDHGTVVELDPFTPSARDVTTPESWLPSDAWADPDPVPFVPTHVGVCYVGFVDPGIRVGVADILDSVPGTVRDLLPRSGWDTRGEGAGGGRCAVLPTERATTIIDLLRPGSWLANTGNFRKAEASLTFAVVLPDGSLDTALGG